MAQLKLSLLAGAACVSALTLGSIGGNNNQKALETGPGSSSFECDLPAVLDPSSDGLPSADELFGSEDALLTQVRRHQAVVRVPSVSYDDFGDFDEDERWAPFYELHRVLETTYPALYRKAKVEKINRFGLLFTLAGSDQSLKPILLAAHQDVVPVADVSTWTYPPFDGVFDGEWLWGRGASDDKNSLTALLSALESLVSLPGPGWSPTRTLLLAFGFDEEIGGPRGAGAIAKELAARYGDDGLALVLDEGTGNFQQVGGSLFVGPSVFEKGHVDVWAELHTRGGHSSMPSPHTGIGIVAELVTALEAAPFTPRVLRGKPMFNHFVCQARWVPDAVPKVVALLRDDDLDGLAAELIRQNGDARWPIQTSQAVDIVEGGQKINALPEVVRVAVNYRIAPQESIVDVQKHFVHTIDAVVDKYNLSVRAFEGDEDYEAATGAGERVAGAAFDYDGVLVLTTQGNSNVTPISPTSGPIWDVLSGTIQHSFATEHDRVVPVGEVMTGNTDTRHYLNLTPHVYRWTPVDQKDALNIHTVDERVRMTAHIRMVKFYYDLIRNFDRLKAY